MLRGILSLSTRRHITSQSRLLGSPLQRRDVPRLFSSLKDTDGRSKDSVEGKRFRGQINYFPDFIHNWTPARFRLAGIGLAGTSAVLLFAYGGIQHAVPLCATASTVLYWYVGLKDMSQTRHTIRRNFPILGRMRYLFEVLRPEIYQYFVEGDQDGRPFSREQRSQAYQRAKNINATMPFGTRKDVYEEGYEWILHSLFPCEVKEENSRTLIGEARCRQPYSAAILNISAMSYGALSDNAILALNRGAKLGNFYHNTGEGGISRFHREGGGDLVWNIGTGYFGCRDVEGNFDLARFRENANIPAVKMIEIKLSQGAKPAHGGMLVRSD